MILAHELAHVARRDYLVNLVQMFAEALLFFNPAVWWIGRQVRRERESCCDAMAAGVLGDGMTLARALADVADGFLGSPSCTRPVGDAELRTAQPSQDTGALPSATRRSQEAALVFAGPAPSGGLLDRVRRLVEPGYRPAARVPFRTLALALLLLCGVLAVLKEGGDRLALAAMPDAERIAQTEAAREKVAGARLPADPDAKVTVRIIVETENGEPVPADGRVTFHSRGGRRPGFAYVGFGGPGTQTNTGADVGIGGFMPNRRAVSQEVDYGTVRCVSWAPGYVPTVVGPFDPGADGTVDAGTVLLRRGFPVDLHVRDPGGEPLTSATVNYHYVKDGGVEGWGWLTTGPDGIAQLRGGSITIELEVRASGHQPVKEMVEPVAGQAIELVMPRAKPVHGRVVAFEKGHEVPVSGAEVLMTAELKGGTGTLWTPNQPMPRVATTDDAGGFVLDSLGDDYVYRLAFRAAGHGKAMAGDVTPRTGELAVTLPPTLAVRGKCVGVRPEDCESDGRLKIVVQQWYPIGADTPPFGLRTEPIFVPVVKGVAEFEAGDLWPLETTIGVAGVQEKVQLEKEALTGLVLDLPALRAVADQPKPAPPVQREREVIVHLRVPNGSPPPRGTVLADLWSPQSPEGYTQLRRNPAVAVGEDATLRFRMPVPGGLSLAPAGLLGYTFDWRDWYHGPAAAAPAREVTVQDEEKPFEATVDLTPAGVIVGRVLEADGSPARSLSIAVTPNSGCECKDTAGGLEGAPCEFYAGPLPFDTPYRVVAYRRADDLYLLSDPVTLTAQEPIRKMTLQFGPMVSLDVIVTDDADRPVAGVRLSLCFQMPSNNLGRPDGPVTDREGRGRFERLQPNLPDGFSYDLRVTAADTWRPEYRTTRKPDGPIRVRMSRGWAAQGVLRDRTTGRPMPCAEVRAIPVMDKPWDGALCQDEIPGDAPTDAQGRFRFTRLAGPVYRLTCLSGTVFGPNGEPGEGPRVERGDGATTRTVELAVQPREPRPPGLIPSGAYAGWKSNRDLASGNAVQSRIGVSPVRRDG